MLLFLLHYCYYIYQSKGGLIILLMQAYRSMDKLKQIADTAYRQGKSDEEVKALVFTYLRDSKRKMKDKLIE